MLLYFQFHYIFNLRDLGRVYEGLCCATPDTVSTAADFVRMWRNECMRIFMDRLITQGDRDLVAGIIAGVVGEYFGDSAAVVLKDPIIFGDYKYVQPSAGCVLDWSGPGIRPPGRIDILHLCSFSAVY